MADPEGSFREDGEEDEEEIDEASYKTVKDAVLFAIDVSESMLRVHDPPGNQNTDKDTPTIAALKCAYALMQQRIISNPHDKMGILLFGTEQTKFEDEQDSHGGFQYPHCYLLADLDVPSASDIKRLRSLAENEKESSKLLVPSKQPVTMANVLFCANQIFTTRAPNYSWRRLFLVTDNDNPHASSRDLQRSAQVRAKDLYDLGVTIELFPISKPSQEFDRTKFYDDIVYRLDPLDPNAPAPVARSTKNISSGDGITLLQSLLNSINSRSAPKRALFSNLPLELSPDLKISVKGYIIFKRQQPARSCYVWLDGEKPQIAMGSSQRLADDTARTVEKAEIRKAFKFGGETVTFTPEELAKLRYFGDPGIRIIGFKPQSMLPLWANVRTSTFIYPSEDEYVGSTRTFSALQQTLLKDKKMGVVSYIARKNAAPVIAALLPGEEKLDKDGSQMIPPGMWIVPLPYADDIRQIPEHSIEADVKASKDLVEKMRDAVEQLQLPQKTYDPSRYPNPSLQWHYRILQALALEEDLPEKPEDKTIPRHKQIHKRTKGIIQDWGDLLDKAHETWQRDHVSLANTGSNNRKRGNTDMSGPSSKRQKTPADDVIDDETMKQHVNKNTISKLTVAQLKEFVKSKGESVTSLKKTELIDLVTQMFERKMDIGL